LHSPACVKDGGNVRTVRVDGTGAPVWNVPFSFERVHGGYSLEVLVWQAHPLLGDVQIGAAWLKVRDIELDTREKRTLALNPPKNYRRARGEVAEWGKLQLILEHTFTVI
jgi:hypothetical protein